MINSEKRPPSTMDPNQTCEMILSYLKRSNLNFSLNESPFGVKIVIKKSFIKDMNGISRTSGISQQNIQLLEQNNTLRNIVSDQFNEIVNYQHAVHGLSLSLEKAKVEITEVLAQKNEIVMAKESIEKALDDELRETASLKEKLYEQTKPFDFNTTSSTVSKIPSQIFEKLPSLETSHSSSSTFSTAANGLDTSSTLTHCSNSTETYPDKNQNVQCVKNVSPKSPASASSRSTCTTAGSSTPRTPPPSSLCQLRISFRNFLSDFKDKNNEVKYLKLAKEMKIYKGNVLHISIDDIHAFNQHLSESIRNDHLGLFSSLCSELKTFMKEEVGDTSGRDTYLSFNFKND